jgi:hypothetical protein
MGTRIGHAAALSLVLLGACTSSGYELASAPDAYPRGAPLHWICPHLELLGKTVWTSGQGKVLGTFRMIGHRWPDHFRKEHSWLLIGTDAAVYSGNSGCALLNRRGQLVGVLIGFTENRAALSSASAQEYGTLVIVSRVGPEFLR